MRQALLGGLLLCTACSHPEASAHGTPPAATLAAAVATVPADAAAARPAGPPSKLNVVLISIDSLRADMPWQGYGRPIAPRLTELDKHAVSYRQAYSLSSYTSMSVGGLLGGRLPSEMHRDGYFFSTYPRDNVMFPELIQAHGIRTMAAHAHGYFKTSGFDQGFDVYEMVPNLKWNPQTDENVTSPQLEAIAEKQLSDPSNQGGRFFAWYHFLDPHDQYMTHEGIIPYGTKARDRYDGEVTFTDLYVGKLCDFIAKQSWGPRTAIIITADHGEAFGEHYELRHGFEIWQELVRVPLMFLVPGAAPRTVEEPRSAVDLAPTILELLGVPRDAWDGGDPGFEGVSLVPELFGKEAQARDVVVDLPATSDNDRRRALVHDHWKIIAFGEDRSFQLFDLAADPGELHAITRGDDFTDMVRRYRAFSKTVQEKPAFGCREDCLNGAYKKKLAPGSGAP